MPLVVRNVFDPNILQLSMGSRHGQNPCQNRHTSTEPSKTPRLAKHPTTFAPRPPLSRLTRPSQHPEGPVRDNSMPPSGAGSVRNEPSRRTAKPLAHSAKAPTPRASSASEGPIPRSPQYAQRSGIGPQRALEAINLSRALQRQSFSCPEPPCERRTDAAEPPIRLAKVPSQPRRGTVWGMRRSFRTLRLCAIPGVSPRAGMRCPVGALRMPHLPSSLPAPPRSGSGNGPERALERRHPDPQRAKARKPSLSPRSLRAQDRTPKSNPAERDRSAASFGGDQPFPGASAPKLFLPRASLRVEDRSRGAPSACLHPNTADR